MPLIYPKGASRSPPTPKKKPPTPKIPITQKKARERLKEYRCCKCFALHKYLPQACQGCGHSKLREIPVDECNACMGTGLSSKKMSCYPCGGTGKKRKLKTNA